MSRTVMMLVARWRKARVASPISSICTGSPSRGRPTSSCARRSCASRSCGDSTLGGMSRCCHSTGSPGEFRAGDRTGAGEFDQARGHADRDRPRSDRRRSRQDPRWSELQGHAGSRGMSLAAPGGEGRGAERETGDGGFHGRDMRAGSPCSTRERARSPGAYDTTGPMIPVYGSRGSSVARRSSRGSSRMVRWCCSGSGCRRGARRPGPRRSPVRPRAG